MLRARLEVNQVLSTYEVRCLITELAPGADPVFWASSTMTVDLGPAYDEADALTITLACLRLWSERTISD